MNRLPERRRGAPPSEVEAATARLLASLEKAPRLRPKADVYPERPPGQSKGSGKRIVWTKAPHESTACRYGEALVGGATSPLPAHDAKESDNEQIAPGIRRTRQRSAGPRLRGPLRPRHRRPLSRL